MQRWDGGWSQGAGWGRLLRVGSRGESQRVGRGVETNVGQGSGLVEGSSGGGGWAGCRYGLAGRGGNLMISL